MTSTWVAVLLALASALAQAFGTVMRHRAPSNSEGGAKGLFSVLVSRYWWAGMAVSMAGFAFQALALGYGSLILVQTLCVLSLIFALPLGAWFTGRRVTKTELFWGLVLTGCVVVLLGYGRPTGAEDHPSGLTWVISCGAGVLVVGALMALAHGRRRDGTPLGGGARALLLGVAGGIAFAYVALLTKGVTNRWHEDGLSGILTSGELYGLIITGIVALSLQQMSFAAGDVYQAVPASTVTTPVASMALGIGVLGERFAVDDARIVILAVALIVMATATVRLATRDIDPGPAVSGPGTLAQGVTAPGGAAQQDPAPGSGARG